MSKYQKKHKKCSEKFCIFEIFYFVSDARLEFYIFRLLKNYDILIFFNALKNI